MFVLVFGHRLGIARALEKRGIPYALWSTNKNKNELRAENVIVGPYPDDFEHLVEQLPYYASITHIIAGTESAVISASQARRWLNLKRNPHSVILKCTDKLLMKDFFVNKNIPIAKYQASSGYSASQIVKNLGLPMVCKVKRSSGGRGVLFLNSIEEVESSISDDVYFERKIEGVEGSIESFIIDNKVVFTSMTEYFKNGFCNKIPAHYSTEIIDSIKNLNEKVLGALEINWGMTHVEYYLTAEGIVFGEVALRPPGGYIMELLEIAYGVNFWDKFICVELGINFDEVATLKNYSAVAIIHPGSGVVQRIRGLDDIKQLESLVKLRFKLRVGDIATRREGVGEDFGHALFKNVDREQLNEDVDQFYKLLLIEMCDKNT